MIWLLLVKMLKSDCLLSAYSVNLFLLRSIFTSHDTSTLVSAQEASEVDSSLSKWRMSQSLGWKRWMHFTLWTLTLPFYDKSHLDTLLSHILLLWLAIFRKHCYTRDKWDSNKFLDWKGMVLLFFSFLLVIQYYFKQQHQMI